MTPVIIKQLSNQTRGFALLLTIVVISIVLAVGISLLEITVKQISLSITGRDSEVAFHSAQGAIECAQAMIRDTRLIDGVSLPSSATCLGENVTITSSNSFGGDSDVDTYSFQTSWNNGDQDLCSESNIYVIDARSAAKSVRLVTKGSPVRVVRRAIYVR